MVMIGAGAMRWHRCGRNMHLTELGAPAKDGISESQKNTVKPTLRCEMSDSRTPFSSAYSFIPGSSNQDAPSDSGLRQRLPNIRIIDEVRPVSSSEGGRAAPPSSSPRPSASSPPPPAPADAKFTCRVCLDTPEQPIVTVCGHLFCWNCIYRWIERNRAAPQCPVCRAAIEMPDGAPERARVIPLYVDTTTEGKDPRASTAPPRPQSERPQAPQRFASGFDFLHDFFGVGGGGGGGHNVSFGLGVFPGLFLNFNMGNGFGFGGLRGGNENNTETSRAAAFVHRLIWSLSIFVMFVIFMM